MRVVTQIESAGFDFFEEPSLRSALRGDGSIDFGSARRVLLLESIPRYPTRVAAISLRHNQLEPIAETRVRAVIFYMNPAKDRRLRAMGFRFESPEGVGGRHHYFHAQPIREFGGEKLPCDQEILDDMPTIGVDANGGVCLLVGALISIYGQNFLRELQATPYLWSVVSPHLEMLHEYRAPYLITHWRVHAGNNTVHYVTQLAENEFRRAMTLRHRVRVGGAALKIEAIAPSQFSLLPVSERLTWP